MAEDKDSRKIELKNLKPGRTIAENIENDFGAILVPSGTRFNRKSYK